MCACGRLGLLLVANQGATLPAIGKSEDEEPETGSAKERLSLSAVIPLPDAATPAPRWQIKENDDLTRTGEPDVLPAPQHAATDTKG